MSVTASVESSYNIHHITVNTNDRAKIGIDANDFFWML